MHKNNKQADVCLLLEGTYPYVHGGVSAWAHDLILSQTHLTFHLVALVPPDHKGKPCFDIPDNVIGFDTVYLQNIREHLFNPLSRKERARFFKQLHDPFCSLLGDFGIEHFEKIVKLFDENHARIGKSSLLRSEEMWELILEIYNRTMPEISFLDFFWSWRVLFGSLFSVLLVDLPEASCYHSLCTGYAGLLLAKAHISTEKPCMLTEHGIYTNERRIEIASADWLVDQKKFSMSVNKTKYTQELRDFWSDMFTIYSHLTYQASQYIVTLFNGNRDLQIEEGASAYRTIVIPNGIDCERYSKIKRESGHPPTIALIGRVVPIKDVKTYIRAVSYLKKAVPDVKAYVIGGHDEDPEYYEECVELTEYEGLSDTIEFTGKVRIDDYLGRIDVIVLTSLSEAQPLVILEAGAGGIPSVASDVGACREMIEGTESEDPRLHAGGVVTALSNPKSTASAITKLLTNKEFYDNCSSAIRERVLQYYNKTEQDAFYKKLYSTMILKTEEDLS